jgi:hypothetical protein
VATWEEFALADAELAAFGRERLTVECASMPPYVATEVHVSIRWSRGSLPV